MDPTRQMSQNDLSLGISFSGKHSLPVLIVHQDAGTGLHPQHLSLRLFHATDAGGVNTPVIIFTHLTQIHHARLHVYFIHGHFHGLLSSLSLYHERIVSERDDRFVFQVEHGLSSVFQEDGDVRFIWKPFVIM